MNNAKTAPKGQHIHNPVQAEGAARGINAIPAFRAEHGTSAMQEHCSARRVGWLRYPARRSASLHLHGAINIQALRALSMNNE
jgi:hypothetical protein